MGKEDILLKEYEILHEDINASASRVWTFASIILGFNTALLGGVGYFVITRATTLCGMGKWITFIGIIFLVICIILMLLFLKKWIVHSDKIENFNYSRAREIEEKLGMWKNWRLLGLLHFCKTQKDFDSKLSDKEKGILYEYRTKKEWAKIRNDYPIRKGEGERSVKGIILVLILLWLLLILLYLALLIFN
jgi:uncharacterized membrane protein